MFLYFSFLIWTYRLLVYPIVVFSFNSPRKAQPTTYEITFPDRQVLRFEYAVVQLNRLNWRDFINRPNPVAAALMSKMNIAKEDRPKVKAECLRLMATLKLDQAKLKLIWGFVDTYLKLNRHETVAFERQTAQFQPKIKEKVMELTNSWEQKGIEIGLQQGMQQGMQQGLQQGLQQGRQQGMQQGMQQGKREEAANLAVRLLKRKLGTVTKRDETRICRLSVEQLEALTEAVLDFQRKSDLTDWFKLQSPAR